MTTSKELTDKELLTKALSSSEWAVLNTFAQLPRAYVPEDRQFVFVPGTKKKRVLLVAHADTVNNDSGDGNVPVRWLGDVAFREDAVLFGTTSGHAYNARFIGALGGDDRAGCAALWRLKSSGHSLLITTGEERGLIGARAAVKNIGEHLKEHLFAVEIDRRGDHQAVFYDVSTRAFEDYILTLLTKNDPDERLWRKQIGSNSDIGHICRAIDICGVNLSAGYINEHTENEALYLQAWRNTLGTLKNVLALRELEKHVLPPPAPARNLHRGASQTSVTQRSGYTISSQPSKGEIGTYEARDGRLIVFFRRPSLGQVLSKKRKKRLLKRLDHYVKTHKVGVERATTLVEEVEGFFASQEKQAEVLDKTRSKYAGQPGATCLCSHCAVLPWAVRHVVGCTCNDCKPRLIGPGNWPHRAAVGTTIDADSGRTWCNHRCPEVGCKGSDGVGSWRHEKVSSKCPYGSYYNAACPEHQKLHTNPLMVN